MFLFLSELESVRLPFYTLFIFSACFAISSMSTLVSTSDAILCRVAPSLMCVNAAILNLYAYHCTLLADLIH